MFKIVIIMFILTSLFDRFVPGQVLGKLLSTRGIESKWLLWSLPAQQVCHCIIILLGVFCSLSNFPRSSFLSGSFEQGCFHGLPSHPNPVSSLRVGAMLDFYPTVVPTSPKCWHETAAEFTRVASIPAHSDREHDSFLFRLWQRERKREHEFKGSNLRLSKLKNVPNFTELLGSARPVWF